MASILVVDDDQPAAELFAAILRHLGYHATSTCSGPSALEHIGTAMPDLVILDMMMPDMNGLEVPAAPCAPTKEPPMCRWSCSAALDDD